MLAHYVDVCCASLPPECLAALAELRAVPGVMVLQTPARIWVRWEASDEHVLAVVLPIRGATLYSFRDGNWYRLGGHLPAFEVVTDGEFQPLHQALFPAPVQPIPARAGPWSPITLTLRPDDQARPTTAMICPLQELARWADAIPTSRLSDLQGTRNGASVFVIGTRLPLLPSAQRLWGNTVLVPLGHCLEPDLPERLVRECLNLADEDFLIIQEKYADVICRSDLSPLSRASLRLAVREATP